jgi:LAO/AO transport system kinase
VIDARTIGRLITMAEDDHPALPELMSALPGSQSPTGAQIIGLTGAPGVGKSTATAALIPIFRARGQTVAVIAVDPSSPITGGALLGDRIRMQTYATDDGVFIRSMASRGRLGGLAAATPVAVRVLESAGYDVVLVETVGVGQAEVDIASLADTTVVIVAPNMGDGVQAAKAGVLEVADVLVVNKGDVDGADDAVRALRDMVSGTPERTAGSWRPVVVRTVATANDGMAELVDALDKHWAWRTKNAQASTPSS